MHGGKALQIGDLAHKSAAKIGKKHSQIKTKKSQNNGLRLELKVLC
jgi:hypothetical protein